MGSYVPSERKINSGKLTVQDESFTGLSGNFGGAVYNGTTGELTLLNDLFQGNTAETCGGAIYDEGKIVTAENVTFQSNTALFAGALYTKTSAVMSDVQFTGNSATIDGGAVENWGKLTITKGSFTANTSDVGGSVFNGAGTLTLTNCEFLNNIAISEGGAIDNYGTLVISNTVFSGNDAEYGGAICNNSEGSITLTDVSFRTITDTICNFGTLIFKGTISLAGTLFTESTVSATNVSLIFDVSQYNEGRNTAIVDDLSKLTGVKDYAVSVGINQTAGTYVLAGNAASMGSVLKLSCEEFTAKSLAVDEVYTYHGSVYQWGINSGTASILVTAYQTNATANKLNWNAINGASSYVVAVSDGQKELALQVDTQGVDLLGLANGNYSWTVRNSEESDNWQNGQDFTQSSASGNPEQLTAATNGLEDVFFAKTGGVWENGYYAQHVGNLGGWSGTGDLVKLEGKVCITDIFAGSDDASTLILENAGSGIALFIDDVYSNAPGTAEQVRLSKMNTIIATNGADVIDLTSQRFSFSGGVTVQGGEGDDVIWANSGANTLFGDAGNDRIIGGCDADVIVGGIGNDTMHGGGGNDIFCFGDDWGTDTVQQLSSGSVVLWFKENCGTWDESTKTYSDGVNSVTVSGVSSVELRFGAGSHAEEYNQLAAIGAF